jgi:hypothetical protein
MLNRLFFFAAVVALPALLPSVVAQAADEPFCKEYAKVAVDQARDAERHERCDGPRHHDPARWQTDFRGHYDWCRGAHREDADAERAERDRTLDRCAR